MEAGLNEGSDEIAAQVAATPKKKRARKKASTRRKPKPPPSPEEFDESGTPERLKVFDSEETAVPSFDPSERAEPEENLKTLAGLCAKYRLGVDPDFYIQISRVHPRFYPGTTIKADGFLEQVTDAVTKPFIQQRFGGGKYVCVVFGPNVKGGNRFYSRCVVDIPGEMNTQALTGKLKEQQMGGVVQGGVQTIGGVATESPAVAVKALDMISTMHEQSGSRVASLEKQVLERSQGDTGMLDLVRSMASEQSEQLAKVHEREMQAAQARITDERDARSALERRLEAVEGDRGRSGMQDMERIDALMGKTSESQQKVLQHTIDRHAEELRHIRENHGQTLGQMRAAFEAEKSTLRDNAAREMEANDRRWQAKIDRSDGMLQNEREERRRDRELAEQRLKDREDALRIQAEQTRELIETQWRSRVTTIETSNDVRLSSFEDRIATLKADLAEAKGQVASQGDAFQQIDKARALLDMGRDLVGSNATPEKEQSLTDQMVGAVFQDPAGLLTAVGNALGRGGAPGGAPPGFVPVQFAPASAVAPTAGHPGQPHRPRVMTPGPTQPHDLDDLLDQEEAQEEQRMQMEERREARRGFIPTPRRQPQAQPQPEAQAPLPQTVPQPVPVAQAEPLGSAHAIMVSTYIDKALDDGEEPDVFAEKLIRGLPQNATLALMQRGPDVVLQSVQQHAPNSQALSPAGIRFTQATFRHMMSIIQRAQAQAQAQQ